MCTTETFILFTTDIVAVMSDLDTALTQSVCHTVPVVWSQNVEQIVSAEKSDFE